MRKVVISPFIKRIGAGGSPIKSDNEEHSER